MKRVTCYVKRQRYDAANFREKFIESSNSQGIPRTRRGAFLYANAEILRIINISQSELLALFGLYARAYYGRGTAERNRTPVTGALYHREQFLNWLNVIPGSSWILHFKV